VVAPSRADLDLLDAGAVRRAVADAGAERVFHLGALASVGRSWQEARATLVGNVEMTLNVLEAVAAETPEARVLHVGSREVYDPPEPPAVDEGAALRPQTHTRPRRRRQICWPGSTPTRTGFTRCERARSTTRGPANLMTTWSERSLARWPRRRHAAPRRWCCGRNPDSRRDFTDVRDVVRAYAAAIELEPGVYNVASGRTTSVRELIELLSTATRLQIRHEVDTDRVRPRDVPEVRGSAERLRELTPWEPELPLERTIADALNAWRVELQ